MKRQVTHYYIDLPVEQAIEIQTQLDATIWAIAQEEQVEDILRNADFRVIVGQPALDPGTLITVVVTYVGTKIVDKTLDGAIDWTAKTTIELWEKLILPKLRKRLGDRALVADEES